MRRTIVNVAVGDRFVAGQVRLKASRNGSHCVSWENVYPPDSPTHQEVPYAFKGYALKHAAINFDTLLWCDSSVVFSDKVSSENLWSKIEHDGAWIARNGWKNSEWTADSAYPDLFPGMKLNEARELNKKIPHVVATAFGICVAHPVGRELLSRLLRLAQTDAFKGPWKNTPETPCGPPDVLGHRHDQTGLSVIAWKMGLQLTDCPKYFAYSGTEGPETCLIAVGC